MPDQDEQPKPEIPAEELANETFEKEIESGISLSQLQLIKLNESIAAGSLSSVTGYYTADGYYVTDGTVTEVKVLCGAMSRYIDAVELLFDMAIETVPCFVSTASTASTTSVTENRPEPDISDKISRMLFTVIGENLTVRITTTEGNVPVLFAHSGHNSMTFTANFDDFPEATMPELNIYSTDTDAREVMLCQLSMFSARGLNPEEVCRELVALYVRNVKKDLPEWFNNISYREKILYMTSPLIRDINSEAVLKNSFGSAFLERPDCLTNRGFRYSFKELCKKKIGTDSPGMLKAFWNILTSGHEYRAIRYEGSDDFLAYRAKMYESMTLHQNGRKKFDNDNGSVWVGNRKIEWKMFDLVGAIYRKFGVDHARNFCLTMKDSIGNGIKMKNDGKIDADYHKMSLHAVGDDTERLLGEMAKFCSVQKILKGIAHGNLQWMRDGLKMYRDYSDPAKIPNKLKDSYPNGLELPKSWSTFREWHDKISKSYHLIAEEAKNAPLTDHYPEYFYRLDGVRSKDWEIEIAKETKQLVVWGRDLRLCVGSYGSRVLRKEAFMICIKVQDKPRYVMHLDWKTLVNYIEKGQLQQQVRHVFSWCAGADDRDIPPLGDENGTMRPIDCAIEANVEFKVDGNHVPPQREYDIAHNMVASWIGSERDRFLEKEKNDAEARDDDGRETLPNLAEGLPAVAEPGRGDRDGYRPHPRDDRGWEGRIQGDEDL